MGRRTTSCQRARGGGEGDRVASHQIKPPIDNPSPDTEQQHPPPRNGAASSGLIRPLLVAISTNVMSVARPAKSRMPIPARHTINDGFTTVDSDNGKLPER
jgi:hypothetical protein